MEMHAFIGCDIGTSGTKAVATDSQGRILAQASVTYGVLKPCNNWVEQHPDVWLDAAVSTLRTVIADLPSSAVIEAICISALYGGTGALCDENMNSVRPALIWMDRRAEKESSMLRKTIGEERIFQVSGNGIDSYFGYTKLLWMQKHEPDNWKKIRHILPIHSYIIYQMTGQVTADYSSAGNMGGIYDYNAHTWSEEMCRTMGIPFDALPSDLHKPSDIVGMINTKYQEKLGLAYPVPLCAGCVDCIASMLSAGITKPGDNAAVLGTSLNWGYIHTRQPDNPNLVSMPYCIDPSCTSYTYGGAFTAGALPRWFADTFMGDDSAASYNTLEQDIRDLNVGPGANGLIVLPYFMGERTPIWDEKASGVLFGLTLAHTRAHIYRAMLEAVAYSLRHIMESMTDSSIPIDKIVLVGGGARSGIWKEIFADVTGLPVYTSVQEIEAPLGDAFLAAVGSGHIQDYTVMKEWIALHPPTMPNTEHHARYSEYFTLYKKLYEDLKDMMAKRTDMLLRHFTK